MVDPKQHVEPSQQVFIAEHDLYAVVVALTVVGSVFLIPTAYLRWRHNRLKELEVIFIVLGYALFLTFEIMLLHIQPLVYRVGRVVLGNAPPYPTMAQDRQKTTVLTITGTIVFFSTLWSIKLSLLLFFRQLMKGLPAQLFWWTVVLAYTIITYLFCFLSTIMACGGPARISGIHKKYCQSPTDNLTRNISLLGAFASDLSTDILTLATKGERVAYPVTVVMILPLRLIWNLRISRQRKFAASAMFSVGILCMITAILRLVQINSTTGITSPNIQWIALWGTVEATTAIIVGCLPTFRFLRKTSRATDHDPTKGTGESASRRPVSNAPTIPLKSYTSRSNPRHGTMEISSSMESLTPRSGWRAPNYTDARGPDSSRVLSSTPADSDSDSVVSSRPGSPTPKYTPAELAEIFLDFYTSLTTLHYNPADLKIAPSEGWPNFTPEICGDWKSDHAIEVLRRLPYFNSRAAIHYKSELIDYTSLDPVHFTQPDYREEGMEWWSTEGEADPIHIFCIAEGHESFGRTLFLDTMAGEITEHRVRSDQLDPVDVRTFFNDLKEKHRSLTLIPLDGRETIEADEVDERTDEISEDEVGAQTETWATDLDIQYLRQLYRQYGWPDAFRREEAHHAINEQMNLLMGDRW
ncbi:conserved hypothetical protein [Uncinocarpus reesii 1704]|uniref:Rhodopsin domain-containing protein n=1 Tax=Uncinocarpus reesii (strain UAMH 1704) TaxID=336963 RepID=C4JGV1_UNCRE|nr:uncharacterized protein UREG_02613 [Uncinocarpus reesii 1704]EEP77764.1 conserved hypothetical protein [Uncinocarpus reesii 1704]